MDLTGLKSRGQQGCMPSGGSREKSTAVAFRFEKPPTHSQAPDSSSFFKARCIASLASVLSPSDFFFCFPVPLLGTLVITLDSPDYEESSSYFKVSIFNFICNLNLTCSCNITYSHIRASLERRDIILSTTLPIFYYKVSHILDSKNGMDGFEYGSCNVHSNLQPSVLQKLGSQSNCDICLKFLCSQFSRCDLSVRIRCTSEKLEFQNRERRRDKAFIFLVCDTAEEFTEQHSPFPWFCSFLQSGRHLPNYGPGSVVLVYPFSDLVTTVFLGRGRTLLIVTWGAPPALAFHL